MRCVCNPAVIIPAEPSLENFLEKFEKSLKLVYLEDEVEKAQQNPQGPSQSSVQLPIGDEVTEPNWYGDKHTVILAEFF